MKHLHLRFISGSLAIGFGFFNLLIVSWQARMLSIPGYDVAPWLWLQTAGWLVTGGTLIFFGWNEVRSEILRHRR